MSKYELATRETLLGLAEQRDKFKKALEEIAKNYDLITCEGLAEIAEEALK